MNTPRSLLTPAELATPPDIDDSRPLCACGAVPVFPRVGMHGDGRTHRVVPWPVLQEDGQLLVMWVRAVGRRFWCPACHATVRVAHRGLRRGARFGVAIIAALLHLVAPMPVGRGRDDAHAHDRVHGRPLPISERARTGTPRWSSLRRWICDLGQLWPSLVLPDAEPRARLLAGLASFGLGAPLREVLDAAVNAHAREGSAM